MTTTRTLTPQGHQIDWFTLNPRQAHWLRCECGATFDHAVDYLAHVRAITEGK